MKTYRLAAFLVLLTAGVGCSGGTSSAGCGASGLGAAQTFVAAVKAGNVALYERCEHPAKSLSAVVVKELVSGNWLLNSAAPTDQADPPPAANEVVIRIPAPPTPRSDSAGFAFPQSGVFIWAAKESNGRYYVTDVAFYASS